MLRELNATGRRKVFDEAPEGYVPTKWRGYLEEARKSLEHLRGKGLGRTLCERAIEATGDDCVEVVQIGAGGDDFHASARHLYESLGFSHIPVAVYLRNVD